VADEDAAAQLLGEVGQDELGRRRLVDHRLRDAGEALDAARQRRADADERLPAVVQLAAADEHAPTSVSSHASPALPFVSVSTTRNSAVDSGSVEAGPSAVVRVGRTARIARCSRGGE
jgi:hypothetical protein